MDNRLLLAAATAAALAATPTLAQSAYDWNGFYLGGNAGLAWGDTRLKTSAKSGTGAVVIPPGDASLITGFNANDHNNTGFAGGLQGGYNYQTGAFVVGIETDFGFFNIGQSREKTFQSTAQVNPPVNPPLTFTLTQDAATDLLWTIRPRIGYASGNWMLYATGGMAMSKVDLDTSYVDTRSPAVAVHDSKHDTKTGWTAGIGGAYAFSPNWSARGEWLYVDLGSVRSTATAPNSFATFTSEAKVRGNLLRLGMDYKF